MTLSHSVKEIRYELPDHIRGVCSQETWMSAQLYGLLADLHLLDTLQAFDKFLVQQFTANASDNQRRSVNRVTTVLLTQNRIPSTQAAQDLEVAKQENEALTDSLDITEQHLDEFTRFVAGLNTSMLALSDQRTLREKVYKNHGLLRAHRSKRTKKAATKSVP